MSGQLIHRFERDGRRFAIDPESCFCFECDAISWDVLEYYPSLPANRIYELLGSRYDRKELQEVVGELEWLRAAKSILTPPKKEDLAKIYEIDRGLKRLTVTLSEPAGDAVPAKRRWFGASTPATPGGYASVQTAIRLLPMRSGTQKELCLELVARGTLPDPAGVAALCADAAHAARLSGKKLKVAVSLDGPELARPPESLAGHNLRFTLEFGPNFSKEYAFFINNLANCAGQSLERFCKVLHPDDKDVEGRVTLRPGHARFADGVRTLDETGFLVMALDVDGAFAADPALAPAAMLEGMSQAAAYYAERLLKRKYFRLDPLATLFKRIYSGTAQRRADGAGVNELAVDASGGIYPGPSLCGVAAYCCGNVAAAVDETLLARFEDVGALTTGPCIGCWARTLCGGGSTGVHHARTGSFRQPEPDWCEYQRQWLAGAIASFHKLSSAGVHFDRVYKTLGRREKPSLFLMARAALTMHIGVRPIEEADAPLLTQWENWNEASYFLFNETGVLLATRYDREMESLHGKGIDQELVLMRRNGEPFGLLKVRPEKTPGVARIWIYFHKDEDYKSEAIRKSFRTVLSEAGDKQGIRKLLAPAAVYETGLQAFFASLGFRKEGTLRDALYLHGAYHDVLMYGGTVAKG